VNDQAAELLATCDPGVAELARAACVLIHEAVPDAVEEVDASAKLIGYTFLPGTYKGLFAGITLHKEHVNIMFSKGAELAAEAPTGLLEGTGKRARHIKVRSAETLEDPAVRSVIERAAALTPRS
jgi:hypothetical protein